MVRSRARSRCMRVERGSAGIQASQAGAMNEAAAMLVVVRVRGAICRGVGNGGAASMRRAMLQALCSVPSERSRTTRLGPACRCGSPAAKVTRHRVSGVQPRTNFDPTRCPAKALVPAASIRATNRAAVGDQSALLISCRAHPSCLRNIETPSRRSVSDSFVARVAIQPFDAAVDGGPSLCVNRHSNICRRSCPQNSSPSNT
jgi:hypothetical protein